MSYVMGETHTGLLAPAKRNCPSELRKRQHKVQCASCDYVAMFSEIGLRIAPDNWECKVCKAASQREINRAIIATYNRRKR